MVDESELRKLYDKSELLEIAKELGLQSAVMGTHSRQLLRDILGDMETNGVPADEDCSDILWNFLIDAGFLSEDGELLDRNSTVEVPAVEEAIDQEPVRQEIIMVEDSTKPPCYTFADARAPECNRCKVFNSCMEERLKIRSTIPCYGLYFDIQAEECRGCLEAGPCRLAVQQV